MQAELEEFAYQMDRAPQVIATGSSLQWSPKLKHDQDRAGARAIPTRAGEQPGALDRAGWLCGVLEQAMQQLE